MSQGPSFVRAAPPFPLLGHAAVQIFLGGNNGGPKGPTVGQTGRHRGGQSAAGAMGFPLR